MNADRNDEAQARNPSPGAEDSASHANQRNSSASPAQAVEDENNTRAIEPPLPDEEAPPLPDEPAPSAEDDGWEPKWDYSASAWYFYNSRTGHSQWENPRVPEATANLHASYDRTSTGSVAALTTSSGAPGTSSSPPRRRWGGYNPAIHGSYDPNADYAREATQEEEEAEQAAAAAHAAAAGLPYTNGQDYAASAHFNRFTGQFQQPGMGPEMHNDENKSRRQMTAFFDVDAAANSHDGRSLKAERRNKPLSKKELKAFKEKRRDKKEEKRRGWLLG
ncbi:Nn.00g081780.m01.CDS01 [Neocucurbitaria sp. VM-36]